MTPIGHSERISQDRVLALFQGELDFRFLAHMDRFLPNWQLHRQALHRLPVRQERWSY